MVLGVGIIRTLIIFKAIHPNVVVHVHAKKEVRAFDIVSQESLVVIGQTIADSEVVVLVVVRDEVVVFVPAGKDSAVADLGIGAHQVGDAILVVIVFYQFHHVATLVAVVDLAVGSCDKGLGVIERVHAVSFAEKEPGEGYFR